MRFGATEASYGAAAIAEFRPGSQSDWVARTVFNFKAVSVSDDMAVTTTSSNAGSRRDAAWPADAVCIDSTVWMEDRLGSCLVVDEGGGLDQAARQLVSTFPPAIGPAPAAVCTGGGVRSTGERFCAGRRH